MDFHNTLYEYYTIGDYYIFVHFNYLYLTIPTLWKLKLLIWKIIINICE
jgi:hypothetical protein